MTAAQCSEFQASLDKAQEAADKLKDKYGASSKKYKEAQRAINAYGKAGKKNGVTIEVGKPSSGAAGDARVANNKIARTDANPNGQDITVTFTNQALGHAGVVAHEGSHVADGSDWVAAAFNPSLNPTRYQTENRAYHVQADVAEGSGDPAYSVNIGGNHYLLMCCGGNQHFTDWAVQKILAVPKSEGGLYGVTPQNQGGKAFTPFNPD